MTKKEALQLFEEKKIRSVWDDKEEKWYFSIVDVCAVLTESKDPTAYWRKLKQRLKQEGNETVTNYHGLKSHSPQICTHRGAAGFRWSPAASFVLRLRSHGPTGARRPFRPTALHTFSHLFIKKILQSNEFSAKNSLSLQKIGCISA